MNRNLLREFNTRNNKEVNNKIVLEIKFQENYSISDDHGS